MTLKSFKQAVKRAGLQFRRDHQELIRCERGDCPILALARHRGLVDSSLPQNAEWRDYGARLRLIEGNAHKIVHAADTSIRDGSSKALQQWLLGVNQPKEQTCQEG